ncbi:TIGR02647 family protein [Glaciecola sp. KUL10]|jgi:uncharacterized protein (TIGR02647 family)|uniref:TIGR02647 family protein n=1 Tax=Glaciecola sp. (strain KUL10) TaxID=2161813 RepID=UPI000D786A73|nr:TIGR02647 family protein [Glaciecola sp. KUL10]GBL04315.1 hypothetical protein KUL10_16210 [Glaciecola sp. KUL10]
MQLNQNQVSELNLLLTFPDKSLMQGIKVHHDAGEEVLSAAQSLYEKGVITQADGGYLTDLGLELAEHAQKLHIALTKN